MVIYTCLEEQKLLRFSCVQVFNKTDVLITNNFNRNHQQRNEWEWKQENMQRSFKFLNLLGRSYQVYNKKSAITSTSTWLGFILLSSAYCREKTMEVCWSLEQLQRRSDTDSTDPFCASAAATCRDANTSTLCHWCETTGCCFQQPETWPWDLAVTANPDILTQMPVS